MHRKESKFLIYDREKEISLKQCAREVSNFLDRLFYKALFFFIRPKWGKDIKHEVSVCAIFRDEGEYLREWIEFHSLAGIDHFYLYNNFSQDNYREILSPYIDEGLVTLKDWPVKQGQYSAYKDFFDTYAKETKWVCLIDIDEFVVPFTTNTVGEFLERFKNRPCVIAYWKLFGASGRMDRKNNGLVIEDFVVGSRKCMDIGKAFINTKYHFDMECDNSNSMHSMWMKYRRIKLPPVNVFDNVCTHGVNKVNSSDMPIQINHYVTKSYQEYLDKKSRRGGGVHDVTMHDTQYFFHHDSLCQKADFSAYKYLIRLKMALSKEKTTE